MFIGGKKLNRIKKKAIILSMLMILVSIGSFQVIGLESDDSCVELLDQSNGGAGCGGCDGASAMLFTEGIFIAQGFTPSHYILSKVIINLKTSGTPPAGMDATLIVRKELNGEDLALISKEIDSANLEFDIPEINVVSGEQYYIILMTDDVCTPNNGYSWFMTTEDEYDKGNCWTSMSGTNWNENQGSDMFFETYWMDYCPDIPTIDGPYEGKAQQRYEYSFSAVDPEGDDVYLYIEWGDGRSTRWIGPYESGETVLKEHQWAEAGNYSISVQSKDVYGAVGEWNDFQISLPKTKSIRNPLQDLFENYPLFFPFIKFLVKTFDIF